MTLLETKTSYAWLDDNDDIDAHKDIEVFVDGSFNFLPEDADKEFSFFAAGWSIKTGPYLTGFGVNVFRDTPTPSSAWSELRSMLSFLDTMSHHFPHILENRKVSIVCDNAGIVRAISESVQDEEASRRYAGLYGKDFTRILYYLLTLDISFQWVKGHADNEFNQVADMLARKAYRTISSGENWHSTVRRKWIEFNISPYCLRLGRFDGDSLKNPDEVLKFMKVQGMHEEIPTLWINTHFETKDGRHIGAISYVDRTGQVAGTKAVVFYHKFAPNFLHLRALRNALIAYKQDETTDTEKTLIVHLQSDYLVGLVNTLMKGGKPAIKTRNKRFEAEVDMLADAISGLKVLPMSHSKMKKACKNYQRPPQIRLSLDMSRSSAQKVLDYI